MNERRSNLPSLNVLLTYLRAHNISLSWDTDGPYGRFLLLANKSIPLHLRHVLWRYSRELTILLILGDHRLCRNPQRHRRSWFYLGGRFKFFCCNLCYTGGLDNNYPLNNVPGERLIPMQSAQDAIEDAMA